MTKKEKQEGIAVITMVVFMLLTLFILDSNRPNDIKSKICIVDSIKVKSNPTVYPELIWVYYTNCGKITNKDKIHNVGDTIVIKIIETKLEK